MLRISVAHDGKTVDLACRRAQRRSATSTRSVTLLILTSAMRIAASQYKASSLPPALSFLPPVLSFWRTVNLKSARPMVSSCWRGSSRCRFRYLREVIEKFDTMPPHDVWACRGRGAWVGLAARVQFSGFDPGAVSVSRWKTQSAPCRVTIVFGVGHGAGDFSEPHTIAIDARGRLFVGDRENNRIQIFDQDGRYLDRWRQFGRPSGIVIAADDTIYWKAPGAVSQTPPQSV